MGLIHVNVGLSNPSDRNGPPSSTEETRVMVDTGATLSVFPKRLLDQLGIQRIGQRRLGGFGGRLIRDVGNVNVTYNGETAGATVVFGEEDDATILGVTALEMLGFQVDPVNGELHRVDLLI